MPKKDTYLISEERGYFLMKNLNSLLGKGEGNFVFQKLAFHGV
jgi:hypothetical protein